MAMAVTFRKQQMEELRKELEELEGRAGLIRRVLDGYEAEEALRLTMPSSVAAQAEAEEEEGHAEDEPFTDAVEKVVHSAGTALTPGAIRAVLMQNPKHAPRLERSPTYLYSVVFRLVKQGRLRKLGDRYAVPTRSGAL